MIDDLLARVRDTEDEALLDEGPRERAEARLLAQLDVPRVPAPRPWRAIAGGTLMAAAALVAAVLGGRASVMPDEVPVRASLAYEVRGAEASVGGFVAALEPAEVRFSDGSVVELAQGSRARVTALRPDGADVVLESGVLSAAVVHAEHTDWRFHAGPFAIAVIGTELSADWDEVLGTLDVAVTEGAVEIEGSCMVGRQRVSAGEQAHLVCEGWRVAALAPSGSVASTASTPTGAAVAGSAVAAREGAPADVAHAGASRVGATGDGPAAAAIEPDEAARAAALELARRAALAGDHAGAEAGFRAVRSVAPGSDEAALAAFLLGRLAFDEQHAYAGAADWFATYLRERPEGRLAREALGRELEARSLAGDDAGARTVAARYLERFPEGPHAARAAALLDRAE